MGVVSVSAVVSISVVPRVPDPVRIPVGWPRGSRYELLLLLLSCCFRWWLMGFSGLGCSHG
jgi:hypothetical protein